MRRVLSCPAHVALLEENSTVTMHIDPNAVRCSGQHPFLRIFDGDAEKAAAYASIWQVEYNPETGAGNVLFFQSDELTGGPIRIYSDNARLARWVQEEIRL